MKRSTRLAILLVAAVLASARYAGAGQAPGAASDPDIPISHRDRVYSAEQFSNTVSVTDPVDNKLLGVIRLGEPMPANFSPLYRGQLLVHGLGFSPDHRTIAVVSVGSDSGSFMDSATFQEKTRVTTANGPGMTIFSPDGQYGYVCSSFTRETAIVSVADH